MWITKVSISQPVFAAMVMLALVVLGIFSYQRLPVEQMPDVTPPNLSISVEYPGASPEAIENDVIKPIENAINTVDGIKRMYSTMREGTGFINCEFRLGVDMVEASQQVRDKVAQIRPTFPREVKDPNISRANNDENQSPVVQLAVYSASRSLREISTLTDQVIVKRLQTSPGVGNVVTSGSAVRQVQVFLKPAMLQSFGIGIDQVTAAIQDANQDLPAGSIVQGSQEQLVRVEGRIKNPASFGRIIVTTRGGPVYLQQGGVPIHLDQIADIVDGEAETTSIARVDGQPAVSLEIYKVQNSNVVVVGDGVQQALDDLKARLPSDVVIKVIESNSDWVKGSLERVKSTILEGAILTVLIVFLFLRSWRSTIITGLTLPISVIATFIALNIFGFTLNFITLLALSLCIGLLIDDAIVVRENIVRHLQMGKSHRQAASDGTNEIGLAVMATTFAILAVFVPVAFMSGFIGKIFYPFGITVAVAVLVSLFVSFTLDPMLSSVWHDPEEGRFKYVPWLGRALDRFEDGIQALHRVYGRLLKWALSKNRAPLWLPLAMTVYAARTGDWRRIRALSFPIAVLFWISVGILIFGGFVLIPVFGLVHAARTRDWRQIGTISHRGAVLWFAGAVFIGGFFLLPMIGTEFMPNADQGEVALRLHTPLGSSLEYTDAKTRQVENALREFPEVETISTRVGTDEGKNYSRLFLKLSDVSVTHRRSDKELEKAIRERVKSIAGISLSVGFGQGGNDVFISILGSDNDALTAASKELMAQIAKIPGIADLESSEKGNNPTISVRIKSEQAADLGLSNGRIGAALRPLIFGDTIGHWLGPDGQDYDVIVRLPESNRRITSDLSDLYLSSNRLNSDGSPLLVPLGQVADFVETGTAQQLKRLDMQRRVSIYANAEGRPSGDVGSDVEKVVKNFKLPPGTRFDIGGGQQDLNESFAAAIAALGLAVIFIYMILASQFGSLLQPFAIMASLPLSLTGVFISLLITRTTFNVFSMIGFIMLMGLVTKNAILLVDFTNQGLRENKSLYQAIMDAGQVRLRPIMMTTAAMIFGMLPMAIGMGKGGELQAPMGRAVIGGIITSTLLTLVVVPVIYTYVHALGARAVRWFGSGAKVKPAADGFKLPSGAI